MKLLLLVTTFLFVTLSFAADHEGGVHTPNFCSVSNTCAHLRFETYPTTKSMSEFIVHILPSTETSTITNLTAKLWMDMGHGHGHGSAPLDVKATNEENHFFATNAWFVMMGSWQVIVSFQENGVAQKVIIPIDIKE